MVQRRITLNDLVLGEPLRWNLFAAEASGQPLLQKGQILSDTSQLSTLLAAGLFAEVEPPPSVLHQLNLCNRRLERLLHDLRNEHNAEAELRDIARDVIHAVDLNADIALACIFLNQIAGTYAVRHCIETAVVAVVVARGMRHSPAETLTVTVAALTMNVGMLRHHESFQNKGGPLTGEEMAIVRRHPEDSANLLKCAGVEDEEWISCVLLHHENDDGSGYPAGVASPEVTQNAKLINLADRYCAQVSARNYRRSILPDHALRTLCEDLQHAVDPLLARHFAEQLGKYPPGCLVRLTNGEIGVVTRRLIVAGGDELHVHCLRDPAGAPLPAASVRHTGDADCAIAEALSEDQASIRFSMKQVWGAQASL
ncbi:HD domain-containing phosphohydrolase [Rugamonas sp.]|uniref:HD-GYP domain-containing protein n=1 Tax=Rugamonas sp. TaxID=1926287 RepID=UPI0025FE31BE|nr:HD domain-containing phosphohydrolase [Rugamonas sp.]